MLCQLPVLLRQYRRIAGAGVGQNLLTDGGFALAQVALLLRREGRREARQNAQCPQVLEGGFQLVHRVGRKKLCTLHNQYLENLTNIANVLCELRS
jgi:hypothetical protein